MFVGVAYNGASDDWQAYVAEVARSVDPAAELMSGKIATFVHQRRQRAARIDRITLSQNDD